MLRWLQILQPLNIIKFGTSGPNLGHCFTMCPVPTPGTACIRATLSNSPLHHALDMGRAPSGQGKDPRGDTSLRVTEKLAPLTAGEENKRVRNRVC